ncbi:Uncharacterised protein [Mycobacteroides abscessus]|nr:Uncharacterised protein [Mycobacteroides abscessus]
MNDQSPRSEPYERRAATVPPLRRRSTGSVSRSRRSTSTKSTAPTTASATNMPRHDPRRRNCAPMVGARMGATPTTSMSRAMTLPIW